MGAASIEQALNQPTANYFAFQEEIVISPNLTPEEEQQLLAELITKTAARRLRWGFQPPSTVQANIGNLHYVLRLRRDIYRLTARRDGRKTVNFTIEQKATGADSLAQLFQLAANAAPPPRSSPE